MFDKTKGPVQKKGNVIFISQVDDVVQSGDGKLADILIRRLVDGVIKLKKLLFDPENKPNSLSLCVLCTYVPSSGVEGIGDSCVTCSEVFSGRVFFMFTHSYYKLVRDVLKVSNVDFEIKKEKCR